MKSDYLYSLIKKFLIVALGNLIYSLVVYCFLLPSNLVTGGTTGLALTVNYFWDIPLTSFVLFFNAIMLIVGFLFLGKEFASSTILSSILYPFFLECYEYFLPNCLITQDLLLCTIFSGIGIGIGLGIVIRSGASTGGMDIPPLLLQKYFHIPVSVSLYGFDFCILLLQILFRPTENVLYGLILILVYTFTLDKMLMLGTSKTEIKIISAQSKKIAEAILSQVDRGVTFLNGEGGYSHNETKVLLSVVSNRELVKIERITHEIDPECFMIINRVSEVRGKGFSIKKY